MCTKINRAHKRKKNQRWRIRTFHFQSQSLEPRDVTTEKLWTGKVKSRRLIRSELQSSAGGRRGQHQSEHSGGLIVTSPLQVSPLTLKQIIYTYIYFFIYIRVYRIYPDSGYKI